MKKHLRNWLGLFCFALLACLWGAAPLQAAGNTVLVLPFQVTAGPEMPNAARDVPQIIGTEMQQRGLSVIPMDKARSLLSSRGGSIDMAAARELGKKAGADLVLFGSFKQNGEGFALQSLLVPVNEGQAKPANFDRPSLLSLNECAAAMAGQASGMLAGAAAAAPAASSAPRTEPNDPIGRADFVPMGTAKGALADVQVRGLQVMDPEVVLMRLSIRKGDTPSANDINEEVKRIWELGYFSDVQAHMEGNVLVFTVAEKPCIENIIVEGSHEVDAEDVIAAMGTKSSTNSSSPTTCRRSTNSTARKATIWPVPATVWTAAPAAAAPCWSSRWKKATSSTSRKSRSRAWSSWTRATWTSTWPSSPATSSPGSRAPACSRKNTWSVIPTPSPPTA